ncbi:MAG TPA: hypothetical protein VG796_16190 [Verrucomicrobiales bacterium]|jgi:hypothetical protein|nr:hypothetical protein [Verrucomicrobiales bacterium]
MLCQHLQPIEQAIKVAGIRETYRGQPWSMNCREWIFVDCFLDTAAIRNRIAVPDCVQDHSHRGTHDGQERGFVCSACHDGIMGHYEKSPGTTVFEGPLT